MFFHEAFNDAVYSVAMIFKDIVSHDIENSILKPYIIPTHTNNYAQGVDKLFFACYNTVPWRERSGLQLNNT